MTVAANTFDATVPASSVRARLLRADSTVLIWLAAIASLLLAIALFAAGQGALLRIAIPAGATITALALYLRRPIGFIHFTLWTWFLTPLYDAWWIGGSASRTTTSSCLRPSRFRHRRTHPSARTPPCWPRPPRPLLPLHRWLSSTDSPSVSSAGASTLPTPRLQAKSSTDSSTGLPLSSSAFIFIFAGPCTRSTNAPSRRVFSGPSSYWGPTVCINSLWRQPGIAIGF